MDQAAIYIAQTTTSYPPLTPPEERRLIRKIDLILVPMVRIFLFVNIHTHIPPVLDEFEHRHFLGYFFKNAEKQRSRKRKANTGTHDWAILHP